MSPHILNSDVVDDLGIIFDINGWGQTNTNASAFKKIMINTICIIFSLLFLLKTLHHSTQHCLYFYYPLVSWDSHHSVTNPVFYYFACKQVVSLKEKKICSIENNLDDLIWSQFLGHLLLQSYFGVFEILTHNCAQPCASLSNTQVIQILEDFFG